MTTGIDCTPLRLSCIAWHYLFNFPRDYFRHYRPLWRRSITIVQQFVIFGILLAPPLKNIKNN